MNSIVILRRLLALRRRTEQKALENVVVKDGLRRRAENEVDAATDAVSRQVVEARASERNLIGLLAGRPVSPAAIIGLQADLDAIALETERLRTAQASTQSTLQDRTKARDAAREDFRLRQRAAAKLDLVLKQKTTRAARKQAAIAEADDEDQGGGHATLPGRHGI